jgi:hypothetical protein
LGVAEKPKGGTTVASFFGLSSSLRENYSTSRRRKIAKDRTNLENKKNSTHESSNSNISISDTLAAAGSPDASFRTEVFEEARSPTCFLFFSRPLSSESVGGGDVVESLSSRDPSASSPSWFSLVSGALELTGAGSASIGPSSGR